MGKIFERVKQQKRVDQVFCKWIWKTSIHQPTKRYSFNDWLGHRVCEVVKQWHRRDTWVELLPRRSWHNDAAHVSEEGYKSIILVTEDTDVMVIALPRTLDLKLLQRRRNQNRTRQKASGLTKRVCVRLLLDCMHSLDAIQLVLLQGKESCQL